MRTQQRQMPVALTIAGSDSGGGAGIQADLKTFQALGVHGTSVITSVTAQNPARVIGIHACTTGIVEQQLEAVFEAFPPQAIKTGMLYSAEIIRVVARFVGALKPRPQLVVDPVLISSSGKQLLKASALKSLENDLLPKCALMTPNIPEAEALARRSITSPEEMRAAARQLHEKYGCAVVIKGGHLLSYKEAVDIFYDGREELMLSTPRYSRGHLIHGTGCTYSAAITAYCARGLALARAIVKAKEYIGKAIQGGRKVNEHQVIAWDN